jgi:tripartite-type tricarboxylate transporter receptor subunit TctC
MSSTKQNLLRSLAAVVVPTVATVAGAIHGTHVLAQDAAKDYPSKPIVMVVPYAAGGSSDTRARQIGQKIAQILGKPVVVDNKPGAAGNIGTDFIARAAPDGYTIGIGNFAPLSVNKALMPSMPFDPVKDLTPIVLLEKGPILLLVNEKSPYKTLAELIKDAKAKPDKLSFASAGQGGAYHLAGEQFKDATGTVITHVPYKGGGPAVTDLLGGQVDMLFDWITAGMPHLTSNPPKFRALAITSEKRSPQLPNVPTFEELGIKGMVMSNWFGVVGPKNLPPAIVAKLNQAINQALADPELKDKIVSGGNEIGGGDPQAFAKFIAAETDRWAKLIKAKNIKPE